LIGNFILQTPYSRKIDVILDNYVKFIEIKKYRKIYNCIDLLIKILLFRELSKLLNASENKNI
jgi:hypothetical protein